jgi:hypothetical protein
LNLCCYHVQISLIMSQQTQSDIFHTKMLQNALWCQITWSKCMLCNILEYCSQTLDIHGQRVLQLILFLFMTFNYWEYVIECVFAVEGHIILKIWLILRILKISSLHQFVDFKYRIWRYHDWIFFNPTIFSW